MKTLLTYVFVAATFLRPSGFVCVEPTGDIHWEYATCASGEATASTVFSGEAGDCGDCRDMAISGSSTPIQRLATDMPHPSLMPIVTAPIVDNGEFVAPHIDLAFASSHARSRHLSSTVIRR